ncbi:MAG: hypothetical protein ACE5JU_14120 [Candidatus Binatia bacterium]
MNEPTLDTLKQRIDRLERENHWWKRLATIGFVGMAALMLMGQTLSNSRTVEAERFILRDANGTRRAELGIGKEEGNALLEFYGKDGKQSLVLLGVLADKSKTVGTILSLGSKENPQGGAGGHLQATVSSVSGTLSLGYGKGSASLRTTDEGTLLNITETARSGVTLGIGRDGSPVLALSDKERPRAGLFLGADGSPSLVFFDKDGKTIWKGP